MQPLLVTGLKSQIIGTSMAIIIIDLWGLLTFAACNLLHLFLQNLMHKLIVHQLK